MIKKKVPANKVVKKADPKKEIVKKTVIARPAAKTVVKKEESVKKEVVPKGPKTLALAAGKRIQTAEGWKRARLALGK